MQIRENSTNTEAHILMLFVNPSVSVIALTFSILIIYVLSKSDFKEPSYKYLKYQSFFVLTNLFIKTLQPLYYCYDLCGTSKSFFVQIYVIYFVFYLSSVLEMVAYSCSVYSGLYCILTISIFPLKKYLLKVLSYGKCMIMTILVFSSILYVFQPLEYKIQGRKGYVIKEDSKDYGKILYAANIFRDGVNSFLLIFIDIFLIIKLRKIMKEKLSLISMHKTNQIDTFDAESQKRISIGTVNIKRTRRKQSVIILSSCVINLVGRLPLFIFYMITINLPVSFDNFWSFAMCATIYYLTNIANFFVFYFFNQKFKSIVINSLLFILNLKKFKT
jgi:hypothetical protein